MFSRTSDQQTVNTLRALHSNGMLSGSELDDQVAADLLSGSSPHSRNGSMVDSFPGLKKRDTPHRLDPLTNAPHTLDASMGGGPLSVQDEDPTAPISEEWMKQLADDCENFNVKLQENTALAKELLQKSLVEVFVLNSQEKLPDCFLRSLPKFGKGANKLNGIFTRSMNKKKSDSLVDRKEIPFELTIQEDVIDEIGRDIEQVIEMEMKRCFGVMTSDMQKILRSVVRLKSRLETLEGELMGERTATGGMKDTVNQAIDSNRELAERVGQLQVQAQEKETQMDILSDQVKRRNQMLDEQRARFHKEVMRYKTKIYELQAKLDAAGDTNTGGRRRDSFSGMESMEMSTVTAADTTGSHEVMEAVDTATKELREQLLDSIRKLKADHAKEKKEMLQQKKLAIDERDNEIYHLKMNIKSMDRIIEVEKRRLMKNRELELKEIQEKYEQKIAALQAELGAKKE